MIDSHQLEFTNRVIIVTGGTGALGRAVAMALLNRGAQVIVTYLHRDELDALSGDLTEEERGRLTPFHVDVTNQKAVNEFIQHVVNQFRRIDGLANIAGGWAPRLLKDMTWDEWQAMLAFNLHSAFLVTTAVLPIMVAAKYGRIIGVGARGAMQAVPGAAHYNVAKVGLMWFMESVSNEYRQYNITANSVLPSTIDTVANRRGTPTADFSKWVRPDEVAELILYLLSERSSGTSGAKIPVYGKA